jgi:hypothetical protein
MRQNVPRFQNVGQKSVFCPTFFSPLNLQKHALSIRDALKSESEIKAELRLLQ